MRNLRNQARNLLGFFGITRSALAINVSIVDINEWQLLIGVRRTELYRLSISPNL